MGNATRTERQQVYLTATLVLGPAAAVALACALLGVAGWPELVATLGPLAVVTYGYFAAPGTLIDRQPWLVWFGALGLFGIGMSQWHR